jgi:hypothetical protein
VRVSRRNRILRIPLIAAATTALIFALAGCGDQRSAASVALPPTGKAYRALSDGERLAVAESCRELAAAQSSGPAAAQLRAVDAKALRRELDDAFTVIEVQRRPVARLCAQRLPFLTRGLDVSVEGAKEDGDGSFSYETSSDKRLTIRGRVQPAPAHGRVLLRREVGAPRPHTTAIQADGRFVFPRLHLRKLADNSFTLTIQGPPNAPHKVHFSAICLDCLAGAAPPSPPR